MRRSRRFTPFSKILVPVVQGYDPHVALSAARLIVGEGNILLAGFILVPEGESLSAAGSTARHLRKILRKLGEANGARTLARVRVSYHPWTDLVRLVEDEEPDLLLLHWPEMPDALGVTVDQVLTRPICDTAIVRGPVPEFPQKLLVPVRGGPYAELALRLSLAISHTTQARIRSLHLVPTSFQDRDQRDAPFHGMSRVLTRLPEVERAEQKTDDPAAAILQEAEASDVVLMGSTSKPKKSMASLGPVAEAVLRGSKACVIMVKAKGVEEVGSHSLGWTAISILVDKWFAENTFHADEFKDLDKLLALKQQQKISISVALPALNEEATVGHVIRTIKHALMDRIPLVDEIVLVDSNSSDGTRQIAAECGIPVHIHQEILSDHGARAGKGEALWKSLYVTHGDLLLWIDTDIINIHPRFVYGLIGAFLISPAIQFVKGFYRRPLRVGDKLQAGGGGRVTELTARPLLNLFYPELSGIIQPLSGEYGGRRSLLERLTFFSGYGVETGLLIDAFEKAGLDAIAQVDLMERIHRNQGLEPLSKMSFAIIQTVMTKLEHRFGRNLLEDVNKSMKLIRYEPSRFFLDVQEIVEQHRPPMIDLPEYRKAHSR